jgi:ketosteroid isomerase-like protein
MSAQPKPRLDKLKRQLEYLKPANSEGQIPSEEDDMAGDMRGLVTAYIQAVGERRLEALPELLEADAEFTLGDNTLRGRDAFVGAFGRLLPIIVRNDIRHVFVEGDKACAVYDFVTDTPVGGVLSMEYLTLRNGRIASTLLVFERLHWPEVLTVLKEREAQRSASTAAA